MKNLKRASEITDDDVAFDAKVMQIFQIFWMFPSVNADHMVSSWKKRGNKFIDLSLMQSG